MDIISYDKKYAKAYIDFVAEIYAEDGDEVNLEGYDQDLINIKLNYISGKFWLAIENDSILGSTACLPVNSKTLEFKRFFVHPSKRGEGLANLLFEQALGFAKTEKYDEVIFWTDARYKRAQTFFAKYGFQKQEESILKDGAEEYTMIKYSKKLI